MDMLYSCQVYVCPRFTLINTDKKKK